MTTPASPAETLASIERLRRSSRNAAIVGGLGMLAALAAVLLLTMLIRERMGNAARIAALTQHNDRTLAQIDRITLAARGQNRIAPEVAVAILSRTDRVASALARVEAIAAGDAAAAGSATPRPSQPSDAIDRSVQLLARGRATGWDVDVFWCAGDDEAGNYATGRAAAATLAARAEAGSALAPGVRLGRIRLRPVRAEDRGNWQPGFYTVGDRGTGEAEAADAVARVLTGTGSQRYVVGRSTGSPTPFYISVAACGPMPTAPDSTDTVMTNAD